MTDNFSDLENAKYVGNAYEDIMMAAVLNTDISNDWSFLYTTQIEQFVKNWVLTGDAKASQLDKNLDVHCGTDIQVHSVKGAIGLRVDGAQNLQIDGLQISDILSTTELGSMRCGEYDAPEIAGEEIYIQPGFNGHRAHGLTTVYTSGSIKNVQIDDVKSNYGNAYGLRVFDGCNIELNGDIQINNINAGIALEPNHIDMRFMEKSTTNPLPQACGLYLYSDQDNIQYDPEQTTITSSNVIGYRECLETVQREDEDSYFVSSVIGDCINCVVKDMYIVDDDDENDEELSIPTLSPIMIAILSLFVIICLYAIFKYKYPSLYSTHFEQYKKSSSSLNKFFNFGNIKASENTPLLLTT